MRKKTIKKLLGMFLDDYSDMLSDKGCTDTPNEWLDIISEDEMNELNLIFHNHNNSPLDEFGLSIENDNWLIVRSIRDFLLPDDEEV